MGNAAKTPSATSRARAALGLAHRQAAESLLRQVPLELLPTARVAGGELRVQDMGEFTTQPASWSEAKQLWWIEGRPGGRLTLQLPAPAAGSYELVGLFTRATNYGDVRVSVNGQSLSPVVQGYSPIVEPAGPISFGRVQLRAGANEVTVELVGKDPRSQGYGEGYLVGMDGFLLKK